MTEKNEAAEVMTKAIKNFEKFMKDNAEHLTEDCIGAMKDLELTLIFIQNSQDWEESWDHSGCTY